MLWVRFIISQPSFGWALLTIMVLLAIPGLRFVRVDNSLESWFLEDDPVLTAYHRFQDQFGNDETILMLVETDSLSSQTDSQTLLVGLQRDLTRIPEVAQVLSRYSPEIQLGQVLGTVSPSVMDLIRTKKPTTSVFWLLLAPLEDQEKERAVIFRQLDQLQLSYPDLQFYRAGYGVVYHELNRASIGGAAPLIIGSYVMIIIVLVVTLGGFRAVAAALLGMSATFLITVGIFGYAGWSINLVSLALPSLLLAVTIADAMHVLKALRLGNESEAQLPSKKRAERALEKTLRPCLITTLTTFVGFLSLLGTRIEIIREFGVAAALSIIVAFGIIVLLVMPLTLPWVAAGDRVSRRQFSLLWKPYLEGIQRWAGTITAILALAFVGLIAGIQYLQVDTFSIKFLLPDNPVRLASDYIENSYGSYLPYNMLIETDFDQRIDLDWHAQMLMFEEAVSEQTPLQKGISVASMGAVAPGQLNTPFNTIVRDEGRLSRVVFRAPMVSAATIGQLDHQSLKLAQILLGDRARIELAGFIPLYSKLMNYILDGLIKSFGLALLVVSIVMWINLRRGSRMLLSLVPNLLPVFGTLGLMGWLNISLDIATITIASIALSILVDDTIHLLHHYYAHWKPTKSVMTALVQAVEATGSAIISTSVVLILGLLVLITAEVYSVIYFGLLLAFSIMLALIADLILLPALLFLGERR